jgi:membrane protein YqaA with SNARE-associated domain
MNSLVAYSSLFISSFLSSTILPGHSEITITTLILLEKYSQFLLIFFASLGNILGSIVNWFLGLYITKFVNKSWFPFSKKQLDKSSSWYLKYGKWSLFLSWVPIIGDPLTIVAGMFRVPLIIFIIIVSISKALRYIFVGYVALKLL